MHGCRLVLALVALLGLTGCKTVSISERAFFKPIAADVKMPRVEAGSQPISFTAPDGVVLRGFWVADPAARATVLFFNGSGGLAEDVAPELVAWAPKLHVNLLAVDYRGTGRSEGKGSIAALKSDTHAIITQVRAFDAKGLDRLVLMGSSMGAMAALAIAAEKRDDYAAVIADSAPTNVSDWVAANMPWFVKPFVKVRIEPSMAALDAERDVARFQVPLLLTVGDADTITPAKFARRLLAASTSPQKELHVFPGAEHAGSPDKPEYVIVLAAFLSRALAAPPAPAPPSTDR